MRQTEMVGAAARYERKVTSHGNFRLDPAERHHAVRVELAGSALVGETVIELDREVTVEGTLKCGLPLRIACEASSFRGIAARLSISEQHTVVTELVLLHHDPSLHLPLARSNDMHDLAADWQMWANRFDLPLILIEPDGVEQMISARVGSLEVSEPKARRHHALFAARRPRFLTRRKTGNINHSRKIPCREIIARN